MKSMNRSAGLALVAAVGVASLRLPSGGGEMPRAEQGRASQSARGQSAAADAGKITFTGECTAYQVEARGSVYPKDETRGEAKKVLDKFFHLSGEKETAEGLRGKTKVRYALALAPDPRHTNLSLMFDRDMQAIEQAAQDDDFTYNSSWLPWSVETTVLPRLADQQLRADLTDARESCPGMLLFRKSVAAGALPTEVFDEGLVVLVVGEQPTGGINVGQWRTAIEWLAANASAETEEPLRILGPRFSGSLPSLSRELSLLEGREPRLPFPRTDVFSGTVSSCVSVRAFKAQKRDSVTFHVFQENDELQIYRLMSYLKDQGIDARNTAILSEDETAYSYAGNSTPLSGPPISTLRLAGAPPCEFPYNAGNRPVRLFYPRDISALRSAYQKESVFGTGGSASARTIHSILQAGAEQEGEGGGPSDTVQNYSAHATPLAEEAELYDIVSELRTHHAHYLLLRCTNPLDYLFLARFFRRAYPQGRIVIVGQDLLFRREIDTTEFRGVMALTNYPLLPRNQHWSMLTERDPAPIHRHRVFEAHSAEGIYMAARYLFEDTGANGPVMDLKEELPEYFDPFWLHRPGEALQDIHPPSWLTVVGRDGSWPVAVLNEATMPAGMTLGDDKAKEAANRPASTMVTLRSRTGKAHYDVAEGNRSFSSNVLLGFPLAWKGFLACAMFLLLYQTAGILRGSSNPSSGIFSVFRPAQERSQAVLIALNSFFALMIFLEMMSFVFVLPWMDRLVEPGWWIWGCLFLLCAAIYAVQVGLVLKYEPLARQLVLVCLLMALAGTVLLGGLSLGGANGVPTFYRMVHLTSGVAPLLPVVLLSTGFYLWTWQATAGNLMLCKGRPTLPELEPRAAKTARLARGRKRAWNLLRPSQYRISREIEASITRVAGPFGFPPEVWVPPAGMLVTAIAVFWNDPPLLGLESKTFAVCIDLTLLLAFLLTFGEAARLLFTWIELRRLLTALGRLRLRRTFAKLRPIDASSLWSMSGSVQRVQYFIFAQQLDAAARLSTLLSRKPETVLLSVVDAVRCGGKFAKDNATDLRAGPRWYRPVVRPREGSEVDIRTVFADAVADVLEQVLRRPWRDEEESLNLQSREARSDEEERNIFNMELSRDPIVQVAEEFVCFHYLAFIQTILARLRTIALSMVCLFVAVCFAISSYPFVPRTEVGLWMVLNLAVICFAVVYVYAGMERDEIMSYISNTRPGRLGGEFWLKTAGFLAGPVIGIATTQFPAIADSVFGWLQPGIDAIK